MKKIRASLLASTVVISLAVLPGSAGAANMERGRVLHDKSCNECHAAKFGGDPNRMYTRPDHKKKNKKELAAMVTFCSQSVGTSWFDDEVADVVEYLDKTFYKFP
ncbi:MAG: cytochrome c [Magnetococcales bacterium]|nr:cytochrome c [Magnetococcales bacterium]MBF0323237.1 cytochrome c [Magnetococcales bacterium]